VRPELPSGTVTFVFTDVEGSTALLDELGAEAMGQRGLAKHLEMETAMQVKTGMVADWIFNVGLSACGSGDFDLGISLVSFARRQWRDDAVAEEPFTKTALARTEKSARAALGDEGHDAAVRAGEAMTREQAIELALGVSPGL
jgi:hypothetical protein